MRVKNFNDPVSMADGTLKTLAGMGGDSGGGSGGGSGETPVAGFTVEQYNGNDFNNGRYLKHDGLLVIADKGSADAVQVTVEVIGLNNYNFNMVNGNIVVCPIRELSVGTWVKKTEGDGGNIMLFYYH